MARHRWALRAGVGTGLLSLLPPLSDALARVLAIHMLAHMVLIVLAGPLVAFGLSGRLDRRPGRMTRVLAHPLPGLVVFNGVLLFWQAPGPVAAMMGQPAVHQLAHLSLACSAVWLWYPVVRRVDLPGSMSRIARIGYLLLAGVPPTVPGLLLVLAHHPLYRAYPVLEDQQLAGLVLFGTAKLVLVAATLIAVWQLLTPQPEPPDDRHDRSQLPVEPPVVPAWLGRLDGVLPDEPTVRVPATRALRSGARDRPSATAAKETGPGRPAPAPGASGRGSRPG